MESYKVDYPSTFDFKVEFQQLLAEGVIFSVRLLPDGSFEAYVGHYMSGFFSRRRMGTLEEATAWVKEMAAFLRSGISLRRPSYAQ
jgi:hypothetical protein